MPDLSDVSGVISRCFLFDGLPQESYLPALERGAVRERFVQGAVIYEPTRFRRAAGILLCGEVEAAKAGGGKEVLLNRIAQSGVFGVASLFAPSERYVACVTAASPCEVLFADGELLEQMFAAEPRIALRYIRFLSDRIQFLNDKIGSYTLRSPEGKLAAFLVPRIERGEVALPFSMSDLAKTLNISRAALYRTVEALSGRGVLEQNGRMIRVLDEQALRALL